MDPVTLLLLGTAPAALRVADTYARCLLLRARAELARAQAQTVRTAQTEQTAQAPDAEANGGDAQ
ncbi:hypothetical protein ACIRST_25735 [Kitasatospora sp. NPDC101447]|uniref:hypothetical protein n=1 Tax=Kitasatospora sp. NPDC101447 TaxID=3364102 RepID=UPI00381B8D21